MSGAADAKTRVCVFCESWESGGIESFLCNVFGNMDLSGFEIDIVTAQLKDSVFSDKIRALGIDIVELSGSQRALAANYRAFGRLLKERRYDVVHLNIFHALSFVYGAIAKRCGVPKRIAHSHNTDLRRSAGRWAKIAVHKTCSRLLCGVFTELWCCSAAAAEFMFPKSAVKKHGFKFVPNGIDVYRFAFDENRRAEYRNALKVGDGVLIVSVGRFCEQKNQTFLLDVAERLSDRGVDFALLLIGSGDAEAELKEKARRIGAADRVIFYGTTTDIPGILSAADVMAFPSLFEGLGIVAVEAQAAGLPTVCSENVPKEAFVTEHISAVSLSAGADKWADALLDSARLGRAESAASVVESRGYDIRTVADSIAASYRKQAQQ